MNLPDLPLVVLDTETTGFVPRVHHVIEYAAMRVENGEVTDSYEQLFYAEEIPPHVEVLTRIRTIDLTGKPAFASKLAEITSRIPENAIIVGQNISFDIGMLKGEGLDLGERPWIDTSMLASLVFPELESYSLQYLSSVLKLNHSPKHRALGDVRATLELLSRCWERLLELTPAMQKQALDIMGKSPEGYRRLFDVLPKATKKKAPAWLKQLPTEPPLPLPQAEVPELSAKPGAIQLIEESLDPGFILGIVERARKAEGTSWIAVKNLDAFVRRLPENILTSKDVRIAYHFSQLLDEDAADRLGKAETFTADEATLALKLAWYQPKHRNDFPLHGGEEAIWRGSIACTGDSEAFKKQFEDLPSVVLIDHRQMLHLLEEEDAAESPVIGKDDAMILDDASMLEDTATKAYGWYAYTKDLRAAGEHSVELTRFLDLLQLWIEKTRQGQDTRTLNEADLTTPETKGLRERLAGIRKTETFPPQTSVQLDGLEKILDQGNLPERFAWIEQRMDGFQSLQSVPESVAVTLRDLLYLRHPTTLLVPPGQSENLGEIVPDTLAAKAEETAAAAPIPLSYPITTLEPILTSPPLGKSIILLSGKGPIENVYVRYTERLEAQGITLVCQGVSGGMGRMRAEFLAAPAPALWLVTPWIFEGLELPPGTVQRLVISHLPFDYYSHPILSRRAARYRDGFIDYFFPRLLQRLFRLLRTFARFKTADADVLIIDERMRTKGYGKDIIGYLRRFSTETAMKGMDNGKLKIENATKRGSPKKMGGKGQMAMF